MRLHPGDARRRCRGSRYTIKHHCVEGWSAIGTWTGVPLASVIALVEPTADARYRPLRLLRRQLLQRLGPRERPAPADDPRLRLQRPAADPRARRAAAPLLAGQARLQADQVPDQDDLHHRAGPAATGRTRGTPGWAGSEGIGAGTALAATVASVPSAARSLRPYGDLRDRRRPRLLPDAPAPVAADRLRSPAGPPLVRGRPGQPRPGLARDAALGGGAGTTGSSPCWAITTSTSWPAPPASPRRRSATTWRRCWRRRTATISSPGSAARPLIHREGELLLVHAGLFPDWTPAAAERLAREVEERLRGEKGGEAPGRGRSEGRRSAGRRASAARSGRAWPWPASRGCAPSTPKGAHLRRLQRSARCWRRKGCRPWFAIPGRQSAGATVIFGHWAALGLKIGGRDRLPRHRLRLGARAHRAAARRLADLPGAGGGGGPARRPRPTTWGGARALRRQSGSRFLPPRSGRVRAGEEGRVMRASRAKVDCNSR